MSQHKTCSGYYNHKNVNYLSDHVLRVNHDFNFENCEILQLNIVGTHDKKKFVEKCCSRNSHNNINIHILVPRDLKKIGKYFNIHNLFGYFQFFYVNVFLFFALTC